MNQPTDRLTDVESEFERMAALCYSVSSAAASVRHNKRFVEWVAKLQQAKALTFVLQTETAPATVSLTFADDDAAREFLTAAYEIHASKG